MTRGELLSMLREEHIEYTAEVRYAFFELSGELGLILLDEADRVEGESTLESGTTEHPRALV